MCSTKATIRSQATILLVDAVKTYGKEIVLENMDVFQDLLTSENEDVGKNAWKALGEIEPLVGHEVVSVIKEQAGDEVCEKLGRVEPKGKKESPLKPRSSEKVKKEGVKESYRSNYREKEIEIVRHRQEEVERKSVKEQQVRDKEEVVAGEVEEQGNRQETEEDKNLSLEAEERKEVNVKLEENEENAQGFTQELQEKKEKIGDKSPSSPRKRIDVKFDKSMDLLKEETISSKLEGLLQLQDLITWDARPNQELLKRQGNMLVLELAHILGSVYGKSSSEVPTKFMLIFLTMTQKLCGIKPFLKDIKEEPLKVLCEEIWKRLVIEGTESQNQETKFLVKTLTSTVLKLLENSNPNIMFSILFQSLAQAKINRDSPRLIQLITTCILKMTKTLSHYIDALEPTALLLNMHIFLLECESNNVYQAQDDPTKATKNLLTELARTYRQKLWSYYLQGVDQHPRTDRYIQGWIATLVGPKPLEESPHNKDSASYNALRKSLGAKASHSNNRTTPIESLRDADQTLEKDSSPRALKTISKISKEGEYKSPSTSSSKVLYGTKGYESLGPESKSTQEFTHEKGKKSGVWSRESQTSRVDTGHSKYSVTNLKSPSKHVLNTSYTSVDKSLGSTGLNTSTKAIRGISGIKNRDKSGGPSATGHKKQASISVDEGDPIGNLSAVKSIEPQSTPNKIVAGSKVTPSKTPTLGSTRNISHASSTAQGLGHRKGAKSISEGDTLRKSMTLERTLTDIKKSALMDEHDKHEETKTPDNPHNINEKVSNIKRRYGVGKTRLEKTTVTTNTEPEGSLSKRSLDPSRASPRPWEAKSSLRKSGVNSSLSASGRKSARDTSNELESRNLGKNLKSKDETVEAKSAKNIGQRFADLKAKVKTMINKK